MLKAAEHFLFKVATLGDIGYVISQNEEPSRFIDGYFLSFSEGRLQSLRYTKRPDGSWSNPRVLKKHNAYYWDKFMEEHPNDFGVRRWFLNSLEHMIDLHFSLQEKGES